MTSPRTPRTNVKHSENSTINMNSDNQTHTHQYDRTIDLDKLHEDIVIVPPAKTLKHHKNLLTSGAQSVLINNKHDITDAKHPSQIAPQIYVENCLGFRKQAIEQTDKGIGDETQDSAKKHWKMDKDLLNSNPGIKYVVHIHQAFGIICYTLFGLLAGASLAHTLFVQLATRPRDLPRAGDVSFDVIMRYGYNARPIAITYFVVLVVTGTYILDKFDFGRPSISCMRGCIKFQNGVLAVPFFVASFAINNAMVWLDFRIHQLAYSQNTMTMHNLEDGIASVWKVWRILDACRTAFILATWVIVSLCEQDDDRLSRNLYRDLDQQIDE